MFNIIISIAGAIVAIVGLSYLAWIFGKIAGIPCVPSDDFILQREELYKTIINLNNQIAELEARLNKEQVNKTEE